MYVIDGDCEDRREVKSNRFESACYLHVDFFIHFPRGIFFVEARLGVSLGVEELPTELTSECFVSFLLHEEWIARVLGDHILSKFLLLDWRLNEDVADT